MGMRCDQIEASDLAAVGDSSNGLQCVSVVIVRDIEAILQPWLAIIANEGGERVLARGWLKSCARIESGLFIARRICKRRQAISLG